MHISEGGKRDDSHTTGGRRHGKRGRGGRGQQGKKNKEKEASQPQQPKGKTVSLELRRWLQESLENLGHLDPSSVVHAIDVDNDTQFVSLILWLEDRWIRQWSLEKRNKLRMDFWHNIDEYFHALECPKAYYSSTTSQEENGTLTSWRLSRELRTRVVHHCIACATSEAFNDNNDINSQNTEAKQNNDNILLVEPWSPPTSTELLGQLFALGFSTGNNETDQMLSILRMKLLVQLEEDQKEVNNFISQLQRVTVGKAKPLKNPKLQQHNPNPRPPSKKSNKKGN